MAKKTAIEILQDERNKTTSQFVEALKKDGLKFIKQWSEVDSPTNGTTGNKYHGGNAIKLYMDILKNGYNDTRYITKKQAEKEGWKIKDKEKGIMCEKWIFTKKEKKFNEKTGKEEEQEVKLKKPVANYFILYNANQIEGIPELKLKEKSTPILAEIITKLELSSRCEINNFAQNEAYYSPAEDNIVLPTFKQFNSEHDYISTLIHEMAHSTGHESRLNRELASGNDNIESYAREELRAEISSVFLQKEIGINITGEHFNNHEAYIASWIKALENDPNEIYRAGAEAEKITDYLKERYLSLENVKEHENQHQNISEQYKIQTEDKILFTGNQENFIDLLERVKWDSLKDKNTLHHEDLKYAIEEGATPLNIEAYVENFYRDAFYSENPTENKVYINEEPPEKEIDPWKKQLDNFKNNDKTLDI